jgi:hypothetical protein
MTQTLPPFPKKYAALMAEVGNTLNSWSTVETGMGLLFNSLTGPANINKSYAIFDAVVSFEVRVAVLDAAIELEPLFTEEEREVWACLSARLRKLYKKRHEVAHFTIKEKLDPQNASAISPFFSWNKELRSTAKFLTAAQIRERADKFDQAALAVTWFNGILQPRVIPPKAPTQPLPIPALIVRIRELLSQKKAGTSPQHQS